MHLEQINSPLLTVVLLFSAKGVYAFVSVLTDYTRARHLNIS